MNDVEKELIHQLYHDMNISKDSEEIFNKFKEALDGQGFETLCVIDTLKMVLMLACSDAVNKSKNKISNKKLLQMR